jgi:cytochrome d ubiquinol oxidase subunit II
VWLLATGGALFVAFPKVLASGLSGFYLAIFLVLWCLVLRGISIEFRSHVAAPMWRGFWDVTFAVASILLCIFFGCALGQSPARTAHERGRLVRAHPVHEFHDAHAGGHSRLVHRARRRLCACFALTMHGGAFLCWKSEGALLDRLPRDGAAHSGFS